MRTPYLVIINDEKSFVYTDKRKVKRLFNENENIKVYIFKTINKYNYWEDEYELLKNGEDIKVKMFKEDDEYTYSDLGCYIMRTLAKAEWNSSIKYPDNGWHICSVCGDITNDIDECWYCGEFVCWDCSHEAVNNSWKEGHFCSYDCYRYYLEENSGIEYNPELEYKEKVCDRIEYILEHFEKEQLINILVHIESCNYDKDELNEIELEYETMTEKKLLNTLNHECSDDIFGVLMELYENETDEYLSDILDAEGFINSLDPNDPADEWFFED
jgi:hypothetical protein